MTRAGIRAWRRNVSGTTPTYSPGMRVEHAAARRFRLASRPAAGVIAVLVLALIAAEWPLAALARLSVNGTGGGAGLPWWFVVPFGVVGFVVAWRKPGHPLGWCLAGIVVAGTLDQVGSFYAI